jgi:hypothetical protein
VLISDLTRRDVHSSVKSPFNWTSRPPFLLWFDLQKPIPARHP